jgi:hypothetical protein
MKTPLSIDQINPLKTNIWGKTARKEMHPFELKAFDYCVRFGLDRKAYEALVVLLNNAEFIQKDWQERKIKENRITDVVAHQLTRALSENV